MMGFIHDQIVEKGHEVDYLTADDVPASLRGSVGRRLGFPLMVRRRAVKAARAGRPYNIVNVHEPIAAPVTLFKRRASSPVVVITSHGLERRAWEVAKEETRLGRQGPALRTRLTYPVSSLWAAEVALRRADHVFCLNADDRRHLIEMLGRKPETVTRIYPAADLLYAHAAADRSYLRSDRLMFAGTWHNNKGIEDLIPAFVRLADRHPAVTLTIVGPGVPERDVRARFPERLQHRIACETPPDEVSMADTFAAADLFVLPSLFEGTPLTLVQAMMSGLPIVTTATCGMKDVIAGSVNGLLVPIRSPGAIVTAMEGLMNDQGLRERLGRTAQSDAVQRYTWDRVAAPVNELYTRLCDGDRRRRTPAIC
jgi:glycosyltransferase involved in cell wall biosynthesis